MNTAALLQNVLVWLVVAACAAYAITHLAPGTCRRLRLAVATKLLPHAGHQTVRSWLRRLTPAPRMQPDCNAGCRTADCRRR